MISQFIIIINELQIRKRKNISSWVIACKFSDGGMLQCLCQSLWSATILWRHKLVPRSDPRLHWWTNHQHNSVNICTTRIVSFNIESSDQLSENRRKWETFILVDQMSAWSYQVMSVPVSNLLSFHWWVLRLSKTNIFDSTEVLEADLSLLTNY